MTSPDRQIASDSAVSDDQLATARRDFGEAVRRSRRGQRMSQEALAHAVDLHLSMIGRVERGEVSPSLDTMLKISSGLGVELVDLFKPEGDMHPKD